VSCYKPYPKYKESGVEWLGEVPEHWGVSTIGRVFDIKAGGDLKQEYFSEEKTKTAKYPIYTNTTKTDLPYGYTSRAYFKENTITVTGRGDVGYAVYRDHKYDAIIRLLVLSPRNGSYCKYFVYFINGVIDFQTSKTAISQLSTEQISPNKIFLPTLKEQTAIANFLDRETAKIDTLIAKQERLIEMLAEKRQALISHAVTKGLDPDVKMKDSGVEWLGEVPEHWEVKKFKYLFQIKKRIAGKLGYDVLSITQKGIKVKDIKSGAGQLSSDYSKYQLVRVGDYAMNHMDLLTGFVDLSQYDGVTSPDYRVFSLIHQKSSPEYYLYLLQMGYMNKLFYPFGQGSSHLGRWRLPTEAFNEFLAPCPPKEEQEKIAQFIQQNLDRFDILTKKTNKAISLLKERRAALISAVVTGKIDVRGEVV